MGALYVAIPYFRIDDLPLAFMSADLLVNMETPASPAGTSVYHPFLERCRTQCNVTAARETPKINLDPSLNNRTSLSSGGRDFAAGTDCYY